jgi:hypothetical protein
MGDHLFETIKRLTPSLRAFDLEACEGAVISQLRSLPRSPFHIAVDVAISSDPFDAARHFDRFFQSEALRIKITAAYTEMNGTSFGTKARFRQQASQCSWFRTIRPRRIGGLTSRQPLGLVPTSSNENGLIGGQSAVRQSPEGS